MQEPNTTPREGINRSNGRAGFCFSYSIPTESIFLSTIISMQPIVKIIKLQFTPVAVTTLTSLSTYCNMKGSHLRLN